MMEPSDNDPAILEVEHEKTRKDKPNEIQVSDKDEVDRGAKKSQMSVIDMKEETSISSSSEEDLPRLTLGIDKKDDEAENRGVSFAVKKGMMDIALLTANANQLRFLVTYNTESKTYYISLGLIILSLIIQVAVGIALIFKRKLKGKGKRGKPSKTSDFIISGIFLVTVINILAASFTTTTAIAAPITSQAVTPPVTAPGKL